VIEESSEPEDSKIEVTIQEIVCKEFTQSTCLCIVSKLVTAMNYDRIMVSGKSRQFL
jgi:ABC-type multidrug transport system fused ATPase/permease subunit